MRALALLLLLAVPTFAQTGDQSMTVGGRDRNAPNLPRPARGRRRKPTARR